LARRVPGLQKYVLRYSCAEIHRSASPHGIRDSDIQHAVDHAILVLDLDTESDPPTVLAIGLTEPGTSSK
jgi:hypothetical protein